MPSPTPQCSSYWKGGLWVTFNYSCQLYNLLHIDLRSVSERFCKQDVHLCKQGDNRNELKNTVSTHTGQVVSQEKEIWRAVSKSSEAEVLSGALNIESQCGLRRSGVKNSRPLFLSLSLSLSLLHTDNILTLS